MVPTSTFSRFMRGIVSTGLGKVAVVIFGLLGLMITTRYVTPADVGTFVLLGAVVIFLTEFSNFGLSVAIPKFMADQTGSIDRITLISTVTYFRILSIVVISIVSISISQLLFILFGTPLDDSVLLYIPALVALESFLKLVTSVYQGEFRFRIIGFINGGSSILNFVLIVIFVIYLQQGLLGLLYAKLISRAVTLVGAYVAAPVRLGWRFDVKLLRSMLVFGFPLELNFIMSFLFQKMDTFLIGILLGPVYVAYYEVARRIPDAVSDAYEAFVQVYFPFMSRLVAADEWKKASNLLNYANRALVVLGLSGAAFAFAFSSEIMTLLFSETYAPSASVFGLLMLSVTLVVLDSNLGYALIAAGAAVKIPVINFARTIISFAGYFAFITLLGTPGAAVAGIVSMLAVNPLNVYFLQKRGMRVDYGAYTKAFLLFAVFVGALFWSETLGVFGKVLCLLLFALGFVVLSIVTISDFTFLQHELRTMRGAKNKRPTLGNT